MIVSRFHHDIKAANLCMKWSLCGVRKFQMVDSI
jgi:hypothetical protein